MYALLLLAGLALLFLGMLTTQQTMNTLAGPSSALLAHMAHARRDAWLEEKKRFWLTLFGRLAHRYRRIWRYCRRHFGWGIEILENAFLYWNP